MSHICREALGIGYAVKLIRNGLLNKGPNLDMNHLGLSQHDHKHLHLDLSSIPLETRVEFAIGVLKGLNLKDNFAEFVVFWPREPVGQQSLRRG